MILVALGPYYSLLLFTTEINYKLLKLINIRHKVTVAPWVCVGDFGNSLEPSGGDEVLYSHLIVGT